MDNWNKVWEKEQEMMHQQFGMGPMQNQQIMFQDDNKFQKEEFKGENLLEKAKALIEAGKIQDAVLCLEAEV